MQGTPRMYSPRNSKPKATDSAVHSICQKKKYIFFTKNYRSRSSPLRHTQIKQSYKTILYWCKKSIVHMIQKKTESRNVILLHNLQKKELFEQINFHELF
jgi:hypothetical protein